MPETLNTFEEWLKQMVSTPTFELGPIEKPDLSPYLIHMTGKGALIDILAGSGSEDPKSGFGYLKSSIPAYDGGNYYVCPVVCFTESPTFALDFFRLRSFARWQADQRYGIGFSKSMMIKEYGVRPVIYLDTATNSQLLGFCRKAQEGHKFSNDEVENGAIKSLFLKLQPLLFPLLENHQMQGFMWEREWRFPGSNGLLFPYSAIKVICCPQEEKQEILKALGSSYKDITIVESWKEYNELTAFLKEKEKIGIDLNHVYQIEDIETLIKLIHQSEQALNALQSFRHIFKLDESTFDDTTMNTIIEKLKEYIGRLTQQLEAMEIYKNDHLKEQLNAYYQSQRY